MERPGTLTLRGAMAARALSAPQARLTGGWRLGLFEQLAGARLRA